MLNNTINISNKKVAYAGSKIGIAGVFGYSALVMLYAIIRSSITIYHIMPSGQRTTILLQNGISITYTIAVFSILMALLSSLSGAMAGVILKKALQYFNPNFIKRKAIVISCITAFAILAIMYLLMYALLKNWITFNYIESFSFWFLMPAVLFFGVCVIGGSKLNKVLYAESIK